MDRTTKLIYKVGMFGVNAEEEIIMALMINKVDILEISVDYGFFSNTYTYKIRGDRIDILKAYNEINLNVRLED